MFSCVPVVSLGTTIKPQQQSSRALKDLYKVSAMLYLIGLYGLKCTVCYYVFLPFVKKTPTEGSKNYDIFLV